MNTGGFSHSDIVTVDATDEEVEKFSLKSTDLLFNTRNSQELVGKTCVFEEDDFGPVLYNNNILRAQFTQTGLSNILDIWMRSLSGKSKLEEIKSGTTNVWAIYQGKLEGLICPIPPLAEQHRIVAKVDELMALCDQLEQQQETHRNAHATLVDTLLSALTTASVQGTKFAEAWKRIQANFDTLFTTESSIDQLKQTILQLAVMGKLVPQNPNDEPATELLKKSPPKKPNSSKPEKSKNKNSYRKSAKKKLNTNYRQTGNG